MTESPPAFDNTRFARNMALLAGEWQELVADFGSEDGGRLFEKEREMLHIGQAFAEMMTTLGRDPARLLDLQADGWRRGIDVWQQSMARFMGAEPTEAPTRDRRFLDPAWSESVWFDFLRRSYLASAGWWEGFSKSAADLDPHTAKKIDFYTRQFIDAMAPSNFLATNPEALKATLDSHGENLLRGFRRLRQDLFSGERRQVTMSDESAFELGVTIAATPGKVVFRNDLIELLQYAPSTERVHRVPLLLIPAWINKFYIFDMQEQNSFVRWLAAQGYTVFVVSWVNPDASHSEKGFEHYLTEGPLAALGAIEAITGEAQTACIGYCLGGTLLAITLAWLHAKGQGHRVASATYLTTMIDFAEPGELGVFIDDEQIALMEERMSARGFLDGKEMASTFNMLRANDLIWSFVVNNYLLGREPFPFDLLYWNADSTRMPARMHSFYLRNMYHRNMLKKAGGLEVAGVKIDLATIMTPCYILSTSEDHIAPWRSTFAATGIYSGPITFTLSGSGHIAGVINPPARRKYGFRTGKLKRNRTPKEWFEGSKEQPGSWWPHWEAWQSGLAGPMVEARSYPDVTLGDAPGQYVQVR